MRQSIGLLLSRLLQIGISRQPLETYQRRCQFATILTWHLHVGGFALFVTWPVPLNREKKSFVFVIIIFTLIVEAKVDLNWFICNFFSWDCVKAPARENVSITDSHFCIVSIRATVPYFFYPMIDWPKEISISISEVIKFAYNVSILVHICEERNLLFRHLLSFNTPFLT